VGVRRDGAPRHPPAGQPGPATSSPAATDVVGATETAPTTDIEPESPVGAAAPAGHDRSVDSATRRQLGAADGDQFRCTGNHATGKHQPLDHCEQHDDG